MSQERDDMLALRKAFYERLEKMRAIGDYSAGAADIRETAELLLKVVDHVLERMK
jgi:hypothetical protein